MKIGQIGECLKCSYVETINLEDKLNLSDFDVIFVDISSLNEAFGEEIEFYLENRKDSLEEYVTRYKRSLIEVKGFYEHGGILFISFSDIPESLSDYIEVNNGEDFNLLDVFSLDINDFEFEELEGSVVDYLERNLDVLNTNYFGFRYKYILKKHNCIPVLKSKKKKDVIGVKKRIKNGFCYVLPGFEASPDLQNYTAFSYFERYIKEIVDYNKIIINEITQDDIPSWIDDYIIYNESVYLSKRDKLNEKLALLEMDVLENNTKLEEFKRLKSLLYSGDKNLEIAVEDTFRKMGFNVSVPLGNNDDLHILEDNFKAVVEIKGVNKSGATQHVMQLEKWVSNFGIENNGEAVKGILILNSFKEKLPAERKESSFPKDMLDYSIKRNHCLMLSESLLNIFVDFKEGLISKDEVKRLLEETIGVLLYSPRYKQN